MARESGDQNMLTLAIKNFDRALELLPHRHEKDGLSFPCSECILFAEDIYVNYGLALASNGELERSVVLWETAMKFAPDSPHAYANLGWYHYVTCRELLSRDLSNNVDRALDLLGKAAAFYRRAIEIRPFFDGYFQKYNEIADLEHQIRFAIVQRIRVLRLLSLHVDSKLSQDQRDLLVSIIHGLAPNAVSAAERDDVCTFLEELARSSNDFDRKIRERFNVEEILKIWKTVTGQ
jgi:tetratricopeptide (TPR) repeat protein